MGVQAARTLLGAAAVIPSEAHKRHSRLDTAPGAVSTAKRTVEGPRGAARDRAS